VSSLHVYLGIALLVSNVVAAVWGVLVWRGTLTAGRAFAQVLALSHTLAFGEAALGLSLLGRSDETEGLHEIYGFLPAGIVIVDRRYAIRFINASARELLSIHGAAIGEDLVHLAPDTIGTDA